MNVLLVDDSRLARIELRHMLQGFSDLIVVGEAKNIDEAHNQIQQHQPDLLFLDIQMPGGNGFNLLESLDTAPYVVFTTAYLDYALKAFEVNALDYLLKPIQEARLIAAIEKARQHLLARASTPIEINSTPLSAADQVFVKDGERCWFVRLEAIKLFEISGSYTQIYFEQHRPLVPRTLQHLEARLDPKVFFRANRQQIINLKWISSIEPWFSNTLKIQLKDGPEVEVSRKQSALFREMMSL